MSNINAKSTTKLRGNETSRNRCQICPNYDSGLQASGSCQNAFPEITSEPKRQKYGGRRIAIQELADSIISSEDMKKTNMSFSNTFMESHFKRLCEEYDKEIKKTMEKMYGKFIYSD